MKTMTTEQTVLEQLKVAVQAMVSQDLIEDAAFVANSVNLDVLTDMLYRQMAFRLRAFVLAEQLVSDTQTTELRIPQSWWQRLKARRYFPKWYARRWPARMAVYQQTVNFTQYRTYPDARIALPPERFGQPVIVERFTPGWWEQINAREAT